MIVLANIHITLAEWSTKVKQHDIAIESIKKVKRNYLKYLEC